MKWTKCRTKKFHWHFSIIRNAIDTLRSVQRDILGFSKIRANRAKRRSHHITACSSCSTNTLSTLWQLRLTIMKFCSCCSGDEEKKNGMFAVRYRDAPPMKDCAPCCTCHHLISPFSPTGLCMEWYWRGRREWSQTKRSSSLWVSGPRAANQSAQFLSCTEARKGLRLSHWSQRRVSSSKLSKD